ncbi:MAG: hypothetical protein LBB75_05815 [Oscillospiraceae bacterium]|nr:hypothetical protein [Oscillospiraceae bacterium]
MACNSTGFPSWGFGGGSGGFGNCFCPGGTGIFRQQCQNNSGGGFFCPPCPWPGGGWPGGGWPGGGCPGGGWPGGGWPGGGWPGGGWPGGGWPGGFCPPCPPQNNCCCCDCDCSGGAAACGPDNPSCNRCPWLDAASVFGGMYWYIEDHCPEKLKACKTRAIIVE